jgi:hypothetical protein
VSTRPDISFMTIKLTRHTKNPREMHFQALKRVFRYLASLRNLAISFFLASKSGSDTTATDSLTTKSTLCGFYDTDWASLYSEKGLSISGFVFKIAGGPIS